MKIQCPDCKKITELEHVDYGSQVECVCSCVFSVDETTVTEEFTEVDSRLPERIGPYPVTGFIGFGGMGKVYLAEHPNLGIPVAVKMLRMEYMTDRASCDRFIQAAKICARINHPNIVRIYDCGYENDNVFLVMEYISGGSAQTLLEQKGKLDQEHAAFIMLKVCSGLMEAEKYGIVHRDIKPENIMFDREGEVKILDLGLSKIIGDRRINKQSITVSLTSLGTPLYMAPEQAVDASNCDSRADIYSIGVTLYQLCTGVLPFESDDPNELRRMHALQQPVPPRRLEPSLRPNIETIILRCMEKKREDRYDSITGLALDLEAFLKNRVLPSTLHQTNLPVQGKSRKRHFFRRVSGYRRKVLILLRSHPLSVLSVISAAAAVILMLVFLCRFSADRPEKARRKPDRLSAEGVLSALSRQTACYRENHDYAAVAGFYRNYSGPLAEETRSDRFRIAEGYLLTRQQAAGNLRLELAELLLKEKYGEAWGTFRKKNGSAICPECGDLLQKLAGIPLLFQKYWNRRKGQRISLHLNGHGETSFRIVEVKTSEVYGIMDGADRLTVFSLNDLTLEEQLRMMERQPQEIRDIWSGLFWKRKGKHQQAAELLARTAVFGHEFSRLLTGVGREPDSDKGSARSR